jgi:hypothetical protein
MDNAARTRQRVLAIFLPVTAVRRPGHSEKGRSKPRSSLRPGFLFRLGSRPVRFAPSSPAGPAAWHRNPSKYRRR